jgi:hypothetical protein
MFITFNQPNQFTFRHILCSCPSVVKLRFWFVYKSWFISEREISHFLSNIVDLPICFILPRK